MKKYIILSIAIFTLFLGLFLINCDVSNPMDEFTLTVELPEESQIGLVFYDAATNAMIEEPISISITGPDSGKAMDVAYEPTTGFETSNGFTSFLVNSNYFPTQDEPINFNLIIESDNYASTTKLINLVSTGSSNFDVYMVRLDNPPVGVGVEQNTDGNSDASGAVTQEIVVETSASDNVQSKVSIPAGTVLTSSNGTHLSGQLRTTVSCYDGNTQGAANVLPQNLAIEGGILQPTAMFSMQIMDEHGNVAGSGGLGKKSNSQGANDITVILYIDKTSELYYMADFGLTLLLTQSEVSIVREDIQNTNYQKVTVTAPYSLAANIIAGTALTTCSNTAGNIKNIILKYSGGDLTSNLLNGKTIKYEYATKFLNNIPTYVYGSAMLNNGIYSISFPNISQQIKYIKIDIDDERVYTDPYGDGGINICSLPTEITVDYTPPVTRTSQNFKLKIKCASDDGTSTVASLPAASYRYSSASTSQTPPKTFQGGAFTITNVKKEVYSIVFAVTHEGKSESGTLKFDLSNWTTNYRPTKADVKEAIYDDTDYLDSDEYSYTVDWNNATETIEITLQLSKGKCDEYGIDF